MAFFDDLGKKLTQAGQTTIQKTKEMADVARISSLISDEERKINNNYHQIGKLYVSKHSSDYEDDFTDMINSITESEEKIKEYQQQIQDIKGIRKCEKCGAEVPINSAFCNACGAQMPKEEKVDSVLAEEESAEQETVKEEVNDFSEIKNCPNCGKEAGEGAVFCAECGTKL